MARLKPNTVSEWVCEQCGQKCWCSIPTCMVCSGKMKLVVKPRRKYERNHDVEVYVMPRRNRGGE